MRKLRSVRMATAPLSATMRLKCGRVAPNLVGSGGHTGTATMSANRHPHIAFTNSRPVRTGHRWVSAAGAAQSQCASSGVQHRGPRAESGQLP
jgi:hypothetical protein